MKTVLLVLAAKAILVAWRRRLVELGLKAKR
jgi:hypothetical protein